MSRTIAVSTEVQNLRNQFHAENIIPMKENVANRHGIMKMISPRKKVQLWCDTVTHTGDLWLSDSLLTEKLRTIIENVATIVDSPWLKSEKKIILKNDTHTERVKLFKAICKELGI